MSNPRFKDFPKFQPTFTPEEMFEEGIFGGAYFRPIHSGITGKDYEGQYKEFGLSKELAGHEKFDYSLNKYGVKAGSSLLEWERNGWIVAQDPYGWVQWYCRFYQGRRTEDDTRQVNRWDKFCGKDSGRFRKQLINKIGNGKLDDYTISPVVRQGLLQWAFELSQEDLE